MQCPRCSTENPDGARFCMNCAGRLALVCPHCGTELPAAAKFCFSCATPAVSSPPPAVGESSLAVLDKAIRRLVPKGYAERLLATRRRVLRLGSA